MEQPAKMRVAAPANQKSLCIGALYATVRTVAQDDRSMENRF
jgi:hypothetical protein